MWLSWISRRGRAAKHTDALAPPREASTIQRERTEILRLIEKLRDNRRRLQASTDPRHAQRRSSIDVLLSEQLKRMNDFKGPRRARRDVREVTARDHELPLQAQPAEIPRGGGAVGVLQRLEERLARIEGRLEGGVEAKRQTPSQRPEDYVLSGAIHGDMLSDVLQMVSSNSMSGIFTIESKEAKHQIYFNDGQIVHAAGGDMTGENAFFAAFAATSGRYRFRQTSEATATKTIDGNTQFLILEALRRIDEQGSTEEQGNG